ncbi:minor tail protein [Arthrobacter phage Corgi]|uniref:Minor tail protein n=1 Tax=Arthrobacter phage Corgi TaxID=2419952 RepID=A0A3G2KEZ8_9CAUD|nr:minor tail protein [Arthrobacter phage Corgi]AYN57562.1 minor tail protein [Arthrobacter phage Corgi]
MTATTARAGRYQDRALDIVKQTHRQDAAGQLEVLGAAPETLAVVLRDPVVTFAEDWAPYVQVSADGVAPVDAAELAKIDPRQAVQLEVKAGYVYDDGEADVQRLALVHLRSRRAVLPDGNMPLVGESAERLAQDAKWLPATITKTFPGVLEAMKFMVNYAQGHTDAVWITTVEPGWRPDLVTSVVLEQGTELWEPLAALALSAGLRLWADEDGAWNLAPKTTLAGVTAAFLKQGPNTTVKKVEDVLSREGWYNAAALTYQWKDAQGVEKSVVGTWSPAAPAGLDAGAGCRTYAADRPGPVSQWQANENARLTVANLSSRGWSYVVDSVAMYWLRPGMTVQVDLANGTTARHIVRRVAFQVAEGTMTVTTREPSNTEES